MKIVIGLYLICPFDITSFVLLWSYPVHVKQFYLIIYILINGCA